VFDALNAYFVGLDGRFERLQVRSYSRNAPTDDDIIRQTSDGLVYWGEPSGPALLVRADPYAAVTHVSSALRQTTLRELAAMAEGRDRAYTLVCGDDGTLARSLLGVQDLAEGHLRVDGWRAAKEYVATHPGTWTLLPWDEVDMRVQTLVVDGHRLRPDDLGEYPLLRRLWLEAGPALPQIVADDIMAALHYDPGLIVELVAVGDILLGRLVGQRIAANSPAYPFMGEGIAELLQGADVTFGSLASPISTREIRQDKPYSLRAAPEAVEGLAWAGFDVLSLANNHYGNYGDEVLLDTLDLLEGVGIAYIGAGRTITEAQQMAILDVNGLRVGLVAAHQMPSTNLAATADELGSFFPDVETMANVVTEGLHQADVVIVSYHWDVEHVGYSSAAQQHLVGTLTEAGASLVIGHHPHGVQGLDYGAHTLVAYGLGNFVVDLGVSGIADGLALRCLLDASGVKTAELLPYRIVQSQPHLLSDEEGDALIQKALSLTQEGNGFPRPLPTPTLTPTGAP
jgi:poly-gamma-glutamate capsule biosynthesis protein CapA/YwtB (metallophosphatase superfamily)